MDSSLKDWLSTTDPNLADFSFSAKSPYSPLSSSERPPVFPLSPQTHPPRKINANHRARDESRKLLAHVLGQLEGRKMPPPFFDVLKHIKYDRPSANNFGILVETVKGAVRLSNKRKDDKLHQAAAMSEEIFDDDDDEGAFSTDETYEFMIQLKDILVMSVTQGWHIFDDDSHPLKREDVSEKPISPFRRSRIILQPGNQRSRSPSPTPGRLIQASELLSLCISLLATIVLEDCRYKIASPRPTRPPNALQGLTLDVAQFLLRINGHDPNIMAKIGLAMIPAFTTFPPEMHSHLLTFFESVVVRPMLNDLRYLHGVNIVPPPEELMDNSGEVPSVAIRIDAAQDTPGSSTQSQWPTWSSSSLKLYSTSSSLHHVSVYYLSSLITPLLAEILEHIDLIPNSTGSDVPHRFSRLLHLILNEKADAYNDLLQIVAYHTPRARCHAVNILQMFWPRAVGHLVVGKPFDEPFTLTNIGTQSGHLEYQSYPHHFIPWCFSSEADALSASTILQHNCSSCANPIRGFGLFCPFCVSAVHFDCYDHPEGNYLIQYGLASDPNIQRVAMYRFSSIIPNGHGTEARMIRRRKHVFRLVNLFTLSLCFLCRKPLWGCAMQGLNCVSCMHFVHSSCLSNTSDIDLPSCSPAKNNSDDVVIDWLDLRHSCIDFYREILQLSNEELGARSLEEIGILYATMWAQLQLVTNGIAMGSIVVFRKENTDNAKLHQLDEFELHRIVRWCEVHLSSDKLSCSDALDDYLVDNSLARSNHLIMFDWSNLVYICSVIKSPQMSQQALKHSSDLLSTPRQDSLADYPDMSSQPFEVLPLSYIRDILGQEFNIHSDVVARLLLSHLNQVGLYDRTDNNPVIFNDDSIRTAYAVFPLPLGLDLSANVAILDSAVESCLSDLNISVNEIGFLLLRRGLWPNGLASDYALRRLTRNIIHWLLAEDDNLAIILRDYLAHQKSLPGVRSTHDKVTWPVSQGLRPNQSTSVTNGGDYIAARQKLLTRYAMPWLLALHNRDTTNYAKMIYEACVEIADTAPNHDADVHDMHKEHHLGSCDQVLRAIIKLEQASVTFSVFDSLFLFWLDSVSKFELYDEPMPLLTRPFPGNLHRSQNHHNGGLDRIAVQSNIDPWRVILRNAGESKRGFSTSLRWLCLLARSTIDIPQIIFMQFSTLTKQYDSTLADLLLLAKSVLSSTWVESVGRQELQMLFSELHTWLAPRLVDHLKSKDQVHDVISFIRISFGACLLSYGCERSKLTDLLIIKEEDLRGLRSPKKSNAQDIVNVDPIIIDHRLIGAIELYMEVNIDELSTLVAKFLHLFLTTSPYLEQYEIDNFILRNGRLLAVCAWQFYDVQRCEISSIRTHFLLRTLVVDSEPFQGVLSNWFLATSSWERRLHAVTRLFRIILDVTSPTFRVEDRQWHSSVTDIFYYFFTAMLTDEREEIRVAVNAFSSSLLPAHFDAISLCWNASLMKSPIVERIRLISFLSQLRPCFPSWKVLSWDAILEVLLEDVAIGDPSGFNKESSATRDLSLYGLSSTGMERQPIDPEMSILRVSLLLLSLEMIADGIPVDISVLLRVKFHLAQAVGLSDVSVVTFLGRHSFRVQFGEVSEIPEVALPCINQLLRVLDAPYSCELAPSAMAGGNAQDDRTVSALVGSVFVDMFLVMFCSLKDFMTLPLLTFKSMLETLCIVIYKHDFESTPLKHLQQTMRRAVMRVLHILSEDISYDLRQLALSVTQAFIKRWHTLLASTFYMAIESTAKLIVPHHYYGHDALVTQATLFLDTALTMYAQNGLFHNLLKRQLEPGIFMAFRHVTEINAKSRRASSPSLRELLLRDTLDRIVHTDRETFQVTLNNIQTYIEGVFYQGYNTDLLLYVGQQLNHIARRTSEWAPDVIDPNPLLSIFSTLIQHNKVLSRNLLPYVDTTLRILLNRSNIRADSISRLLQVTTTLFRNTNVNGPSQTPNGVLLLMLEILGDGLRIKTRMLTFTMKSMLEVITTAGVSESSTSVAEFPSALLGLVDPGIHFLQIHVWLDVSSEDDFAASLAVAKMLLQIAVQDSSVITKLSERDGERHQLNHTNLRIRAWNLLALAALLEPEGRWVTLLLAQLPSFSRAHHAAMRVYAQPETIPPEPSTADINHAYIAIKLWVLMVQRVSTINHLGDSQVYEVWNELWPPFEGLINVFEFESRTGQYLTFETLVMSSVADLFVFLRSLQNPIALHISTHIATLNRLRQLGHRETGTIKLTRAIKYMSEPPPETSFNALVNQVAKDVVAAEKLRALEVKTFQDRKAPERHRRERTTTS